MRVLIVASLLILSGLVIATPVNADHPCGEELTYPCAPTTGGCSSTNRVMCDNEDGCGNHYCVLWLGN